MKKVVLAGAMILAGVAAVVAQSDPIAARKALMKGNNDNARILVRMTRGEEPHDAAKVNAAFAQWAETAQKLPALFPDNSKTGKNVEELKVALAAVTKTCDGCHEQYRSRPQR
jgi:cytochrome c556